MKTEQIVALAIVVLFVIFFAGLFFFTKKQGEVEMTAPPQQASSESEPVRTADTATQEAVMQEKEASVSPTIAVNKNYTASLVTSEGTIKIRLNTKETPITANNFITLAKKNFYNNTIFHRVLKGFMIQGGDPNGDGTGGPGYRFDDEKFEGDYMRGTVAMANAGPNTNGSQFFIMHQDYALPKNYVIFGKVVEGLDVIDKIAESQVEDNGSGEISKPVTPIKVLSVGIVEE